MKLKQDPKVFLGPTATGLLGLGWAIWGDQPLKTIGALIFAFSVVFWVFVGFVIDPKSGDSK